MPLTAKQRATLGLICDTFTPGDGAELPSATQIGAVDVVEQLLERNPSAPDGKAFDLLLNAWDSRTFGLLTGRGARRFSSLTPQDREQALLGLGGSRIARKRALFQALKSAAVTAYYVASGPTGIHPAWERMGFTPPPGPLPDAPAPGLRPVQPTEDTTLDCDVVVIGSGAGGGTAAGVLAAAGLAVVVVERGGYYDDANFGSGELDGLLRLYAPGPATTAEGQLGLVAGTCLGGGTVVNWTTSFRTPDSVRDEWASLGAKQFAADEFTEALDAVERRISVNRDHSAISARDTVLERGATELGWHIDAMPRNVRNCDAGIECGRCGFGCRIGAKQSVVKTWLADAAENGARILIGTDVRKIMVNNGSAAGVEAVTTDGKSITIRSRAVVVAAGAIQTPALLGRSGITGKNIGRYLRLHPATAVFGTFDEEIRPWEGGMQTRYSTQHADLDGAGYGVIYETGPMTPAMSVGFMNWSGGAQHRDAMLNLAHTVAVGVITRDRDHGKVSTDRDGEAVVRYRLSEYDKKHMHAGIEGAARLLEAAGARRISSGHQAGPAYEPGVHGSYDEFVAQCHSAGYDPGRCAMGALHIMGSARMGGSAADSATDPDGVVWGYSNLVVADGSCFPTASGVNPMVSIEAIAYMNATRLAARLR
ncbi:GMC family oxidoreductase N-terminal domain-containing protein [Nocardia sp. CWNU-33]|uniref:GMC family oxidoreductase N-terminal domain-containing protein n=1 Tax=Nocardia sp. CWNU-33 TaxID=3392117 RepID=UPI00398E6829